MDIRDKRVMVFGGWGLVGRAVSKELLPRAPSQLVVTSLRQSEIDEVLPVLQPLGDRYGTEVVGEWGDLFVRESMKDVPRGEMYRQREHRHTLIGDIYDDLSDDVLETSFLYRLIRKYRPHIIVDCINTATAFAYQNLFEKVAKIRQELQSGAGTPGCSDEVVEDLEQLIASQYIPQLIRHIQILYLAMVEQETECYMKIGTTGTGGMGLNVPFTHSEEKPSKLLLSKSSVAGAHSMLLFLMARSPDGPVVKEIKPAAAVAWKEIGYGKIRRHGTYIPVYDCPVEAAHLMDEYLEKYPEQYWEEVPGEVVESVYIDAGENGYYSTGEFAVITAEGLMEFVTPEEIAAKVLMEIEGGITGKDVVGALDAAVLNSSYRGGTLRDKAISRMRELEAEHDTKSIAFELLGPPKITKLLYEIYLLKRITGDIRRIPDHTPDNLSREMVALLREEQPLRRIILSIGTGILLPEGNKFLRGPVLSFPRFEGVDVFPSSPDRINYWADNGWLDLREQNMKKWQTRIEALLAELAQDAGPDHSSAYYHWRKYNYQRDPSELGAIVSWILDREEQGARIK